MTREQSTAEPVGEWKDAVQRHCFIWLLAGTLLLTVWWHVFGLIEADRLRTQEATENQVSNLARVSQEHAERTLASVDQTLRMVQMEYRSHGRKMRLVRMLDSRIFDTRVLLQVALTDARGTLTQSTLPFHGKVDLSDREHFKAQLAGDRDTLYISRPVVGRNSGKVSVQLTRRLTDRSGRFDGVVIASLDPAYFTRFYGELQLGKMGVATLFGLDGVVRARHVGGVDQFEGDLSASPVFNTWPNRNSAVSIPHRG